MDYVSKEKLEKWEAIQRGEQVDSLLLGIETSCDETSAAVIRNGSTILSNIISSQIDIHKKFGGVVPELASRHHVELVNPVIGQALEEAGVGWLDLDGIAVTYGPGLVGALLIGLSAAKALAYAYRLPLVGVNHMEGHICANFLTKPDLQLPAVCLVVSGGHTEIIYIEEQGKYELLGSTRDDAAGEAFDKIARALELGYPGGPIIDKLAQLGNPHVHQFPKGLAKEDTLDFSFSGVKSAVLNYLNQKKNLTGDRWLEDLAAGFQHSVVEVLVEKAIKAARLKRVKQMMLAGGVASNSQLRIRMLEECQGLGISLTYPPPVLCTDNAAMIACAGYYNFQRGKRASLYLNAFPNLELGVEKY